MVFSRAKILEEIKSKSIVIQPFNEENLGVASYDLTLDLTNQVTLGGGKFIIVKTLEKLTLSPSVACFVSTRGSFAAKGINALQSSIFCEPDTDNQITLEVSNSSTESIVLLPGMSIAKAIFVAVV